MADSKYNSNKYGPNKTPEATGVNHPIQLNREYKLPLTGNGEASWELDDGQLVNKGDGYWDDTQNYPNGSGGLLPSGEANFFDTSQSHTYNEDVFRSYTTFGGSCNSKNYNNGPSGINAFYPSGNFEKLRNYFVQEAQFNGSADPPELSENAGRDFVEWVLHQRSPIDGSLGLKSGVYLTYPESEWDLSDWTGSGIFHYDSSFHGAATPTGWRLRSYSQARHRLGQSQYSNTERAREVELEKARLYQIRDYIPNKDGTIPLKDLFTPYIHYSPYQDFAQQPHAVYINYLADYKPSKIRQSPYT